MAPLVERGESAGDFDSRAFSVSSNASRFRSCLFSLSVWSRAAAAAALCRAKSAGPGDGEAPFDDPQAMVG